MAEDKPQIPPPRFPVREFHSPNFADGFYTEVIKRTDPAYMAVGAPQRGALYSTIQGASTQVIAQFPNLYFLDEQRLGQSHEFVVWIWASDPAAQDSYNSEVTYAEDQLAYPTFKRVYSVRRETRNAGNFGGAMFSTLTSIIAIQVIAGGGSYSKRTIISFSSGSAKAVPVIAQGILIAIIVTKGGGVYTTPPTVIITDAGGGTGGVATAQIQPQSAQLVRQIEQEFPDDSPWRWEFVRIVLEYRTLPGPILADIVPDPELGIPVMTTTQQRAATDQWVCGEIAPVSFNISAATVATQTVITLSGYPTIPDIFAGEWLVVSGTSNTTPTLNGTWQVVAVNGNQITLNKQLTNVSGTVGGTVQRYSYAFVARNRTENGNVFDMVTTRAIASDITGFNESTKAFRPYPFPDALIDILEYKDTASTTNLTDPLNYSYSWSGGVGFKILPGFRGDCAAQRLRFFSMGPLTTYPTDPDTALPYAPTVVIPAVGTVTVQGGSFSQSFHFGGGGGGIPPFTLSTSNTFKGTTVPSVLTSAYTGPTVVGSGQATFNIDLPDSIIKDPGSSARAGFTQGDIIRAIDEPVKLRGTGVYMLTVWRIVCPYTTGVGPA